MTCFPDIDLGEEANVFRAAVREWLATQDLAGRAAARAGEPPNHRNTDQAFSRSLAAKGWLGLTWPQEFGGGKSPLLQLVLEEELAYARAPIGWHFVAVNMIGPTLIDHATAAMQAELLPAILAGEICFCLGYSEPDHGSDLANLQFRARRSEDGWVLRGEKTFNTGAGYANYIWLAARTGPADSKRRGISVFAVPMNLPGISVVPMYAMSGHRANSVHFDDVRIPHSALVGEENRGWDVIVKALTFERIALAAIAARARAYFDLLIDYVRGAGAAAGSPHIRDQIGMLAADLEVARVLAASTAKKISGGQAPLLEAAMLKVHSSEFMQRLTTAALDICAVAGGREDEALARLREVMGHALLDSFMYTIGGGTNEIQRNLIAGRGLDLK